MIQKMEKKKEKYEGVMMKLNLLNGLLPFFPPLYIKDQLRPV